MFPNMYGRSCIERETERTGGAFAVDVETNRQCPPRLSYSTWLSWSILLAGSLSSTQISLVRCLVPIRLLPCLDCRRLCTWYEAGQRVYSLTQARRKAALVESWVGRAFPSILAFN